MIPKSFELYGRKITIEEMSQDESSRYGVSGTWHQHLNLIKLSQEPMDDHYREHVFFHELAHCLLDLSGQEELSKDESYVDTLGGLIHQFVRSQRFE
jgi:Zn-dependent peptidase ImmA (M78 family)